MNNAVIINGDDSVVVAIEPIKRGDSVIYLEQQSSSVVATEDIPIYHKIAIKNINAGTTVVKYGQNIGEAIFDIAKGGHVHVHNLQGVRENLDNK